MRSVALWRSSVIALLLFVFDKPAGLVGEEPRTTVVVTGDEQAVVEQYVSDWKRPDQECFASVLDFVHTVLVQRGDPSPDAAELRQKAVAAMASVRWKQAPAPTSTSEDALYSTWLEQVQDSGSLAVVLRDSSWSSDKARRKGIDAGIQAMLGKTGWLLSRDRAESIRKMMAARKRGAAESSGPPAPFVLKQLRPGVLYLHIPTFEDKDIGQRVVKELRKELTAGLDAVLIDLRDNSGGQPEQANAVADVFLDRQPLQIMRFADGRLVEIVSHAGASEVVVAVLVNRHTASSAEMLAMALRDNDRATLVGERTAGALFGKDGVDLLDGRMLFFRCEPTILSPSHANYAVRGIPPHKVVVAKQSDGDAVVQEALDAVLVDRENSERSVDRGSHESRP